MGGWPERAAFHIDGSEGSDARAFRWGDVFLFALLSGEWEPFERRLLERAALLRGADAQACGEATTAFRQAWGLLSADDTEAWLHAWGLETEAWERVLYAERLQAEGDSAASSDDLPDHEVFGLLWAEAVCSSAAIRFAQALAGVAALGAEARAADASAQPPASCPRLLRRWLGWPDDEIEARLEALAQLFAVSQQGRAARCAPAAVAELVERRRLPWVRLAGVQAEFAKEGTAREARLRVGDDGEPLARVAVEAGARACEIRCCLEDLSPELQPAASAAQPGELVGPVRAGGGFALLQVTGRAAPEPRDPVVRLRAEAALEALAAARAMHDHVRWEPPLREALG